MPAESSLANLDGEALFALSKQERRAEIRAHLDTHGIADARAVASAWSDLLVQPSFRAIAGPLLPTLAKVGRPGRAAGTLEECVSVHEAQHGSGEPVLTLVTASMICELAGASSRASRLMATDPALAVQLSARTDLTTDMPDYLEPLRGYVAQYDDPDLDAFDRELRRFRNRHMLRIALKELRGADVRRTSAELADLGSACVQVALDYHLAKMIEQFGAPEPPCAHSVIGMGKLGGRELNFSSDIDVIYFYEHDEGGAGELTQHEFHVKLFEKMQHSLSRRTELGFVFRVDPDLRPEGKPGALANSLLSAERYYETWGRTWERAAWIRARPVAGDPELGGQIMEMMRPFVFRRTFDLAAVESILEMKEQIDVERKKRSLSKIRPGLDLKLASGGIREIEFFVQAQQLLYGGRNPRLRDPSALETLQRLESAGIVSAQVAANLADTYLLLRKVEHRIQIVDEQQTHSLPTNKEALDALARSLGYESSVALKEDLDSKMAEAHEVFTAMSIAAKDQSPIPSEVALFTDETVEESDRATVIRELGAEHPFEAVASMNAAIRSPSSPFHPHAPEEVSRLARQLVVDCIESPDMDRALRHLPRLAQGFVLYPGLFSQLRRPSLRRGVARVLGASDLLARILTASPRLLPYVLSGHALPSQSNLRKAINDRLDAYDPDDIESALSVLRSTKQEQTLRIAVADMADELEVTQVGLHLSELATVLVEAALGMALRLMTERYGAPKTADGRDAEIVVIGGGTFGAQEMGYRTDLDLSFIYSEDAKTEGGKKDPIRAQEFFTRVVQRMLQYLTLRTAQGDLYPCDMRLRPSGNKGALVTSLGQFEAYHQKSAQLWERQALIRCQVVAGSASLGETVRAAIARVAFSGPVEEAAAKVHAMRVRMRKERSSARDGVMDLKLGHGGLVEVEFLVQYLLIAHGAKRPEIRVSNTRAALSALGAAGVMNPERAEAVGHAYGRLRKVQNWLRIAHDQMLDEVDLSEANRRGVRALALAVGYQGEDAQDHLVSDLVSDSELIHSCYRDVLGVSEAT